MRSPVPDRVLAGVLVLMNVFNVISFLIAIHISATSDGEFNLSRPNVSLTLLVIYFLPWLSIMLVTSTPIYTKLVCAASPLSPAVNKLLNMRATAIVLPLLTGVYASWRLCVLTPFFASVSFSAGFVGSMRLVGILRADTAVALLRDASGTQPQQTRRRSRSRTPTKRSRSLSKDSRGKVPAAVDQHSQLLKSPDSEASSTLISRWAEASFIAEIHRGVSCPRGTVGFNFALVFRAIRTLLTYGSLMFTMHIIYTFPTSLIPSFVSNHRSRALQAVLRYPTWNYLLDADYLLVCFMIGVGLDSMLRCLNAVYGLLFGLYGFQLRSNQVDPIGASISMRDFWGKRWNRWVSETLRFGVYDSIAPHVGPAVATFFVFAASGVLHMGIALPSKVALSDVAAVGYFFAMNWLWVALEVAFSRKKDQLHSSSSRSSWWKLRVWTLVKVFALAPLVAGPVAKALWLKESVQKA